MRYLAFMPPCALLASILGPISFVTAQDASSVACDLSIQSGSTIEAVIALRNRSSSPLVLDGEVFAGEPQSLLVLDENGAMLEPPEIVTCTARAPTTLAPGGSVEISLPISAGFDLAQSTRYFVALADPLAVSNSAGTNLGAVDCSSDEFTSPSVSSTAQSLANSVVNSCSGSRETTWRNAQRVARYIMQSRISHAIADGVGKAPHWILGRFLERGSVLSQATADLYKRRVDDIHAALREGHGPGVKCMETTHPVRCSKEDTRGRAGLHIALCPAFFEELDFLGQAATLVHEITHSEHGTIDIDSANSDARLADISKPHDVFSGAFKLLKSGEIRRCKGLKPRARKACHVFAPGPLHFACGDEWNCKDVPADVAPVWEAITDALVLDHFDTLYQGAMGRAPTVDELELELLRVHASSSPIDEFATVTALVRSSASQEVLGTSSYATHLASFRAHADRFDWEDLDIMASSALENDPFARPVGPPLADYVRFVGKEVSAASGAADFFRGTFAAKLAALL